MFFLAVVMIALWAVLCYGLPSFGLHGHGANAMLAHARTHGGTTGILLVGLSVIVLVVVTTVVFRSEPERTPAQTIAVWVTIILSSWAMVLYLQWGHAWVAQGGGPRKALTAVVLAVVWLLFRLAYQVWLTRQLRRMERMGLVRIAPDEGVREGRWR